MTKTTDLQDVRANPASFTWGEILRFHDVGPYTIIEHMEHADALERQRSFHAYVDGKDTHSGYFSLDAALVGCIAYRNLEKNKARWMADGCNTLLGIK